MNLFISAVLAAILASFFSMLIYRLNQGISLLKPARSICPRCRHKLSPLDLVPIFSYLFLKGRCRWCKKPINSDYFWLEILFVGWVLLGSLWHWPWYFILFNLALTAVFFSDLRYRQIPYTFTLLTAGLLLVPNYQQIFFNLGNLSYVLVLFVLIKLLEKTYYRQEIFGGADYLLYIILALYFKQPQFILLFYLSFFIGALTGIFLLAGKIKKSRDFIPFAPFIIIAFYLVYFWGEPILNWYTKIFYG